MISFLFAGLLLPIFSKMLKNKEPVEQLVQFSYRLILVPVVIFVVGAVAYSDDLMKFLYHGADLKYSAVIFSVIIPGLIAISTTYIYGTLLTANGKLKYLNIMAASAMLINIILNFILIPRFNALGSAISSLATQSLTAVFQILLANQIFKFKVNWRFVNILLVFVAGVIGVGILVKHTFESWYYGFALIGIVGIMAAFALKLIDLKGIYHIVKNGDEDKS
jgi:O-antigen/teichoic acid export membrane protein